MVSTKKTKVAIYLPTLNMGGSERVNLFLAEGLIKYYNVYVIIGNNSGDLTHLVPPGIVCINLNVARSRFAILKLRRILIDYNIDILITSLFHTSFVSAIVRLLLPWKFILILREDSTPSMYIPKYNWRYFAYLFNMYMADRLFTVGEEVRADVLSFTGVSEKKIFFLPSPILKEENTNPQIELLPAFSGIQLMSLCRIIPAKGIDMLIRMLGILREKVEARLILVGPHTNKKYLDELRELSAALNVNEHVIFYGATNNPMALLAQCDVFVFGSHYEGLPGVLVEAMSLGKKIVSTRCKSGTAELLQDGALGKLVDVHDHQGMAKAVLEYLDEPALIEKLKMAASPFFQENAVLAYVSHIEQLIAQKNIR